MWFFLLMGAILFLIMELPYIFWLVVLPLGIISIINFIAFNESEGNYYFEFIGEQYMQAEFPRSFYDRISEELSDRFPEENTFIVDLAWAKSVLGI